MHCTATPGLPCKSEGAPAAPSGIRENRVIRSRASGAGGCLPPPKRAQRQRLSARDDDHAIEQRSAGRLGGACQGQDAAGADSPRQESDGPPGLV
jgi:hypothetical protein